MIIFSLIREVSLEMCIRVYIYISRGSHGNCDISRLEMVGEMLWFLIIERMWVVIFYRYVGL